MVLALYRLCDGGDNDLMHVGVLETLLTVTAWKIGRPLLGLKGFEEEYPDHRKCYMTLCGANGLVSRGFMERGNDGRVRLTEAGLAWGREVSRRFSERSIN